MRLIPIKIFRVAERSMEPGIYEGSYVLVNCWYRKLSAGDIIVFGSPEDGRVLVKRIKKIQKGRIFAVGDNKARSRDSRRFGSFDSALVIGKAILSI